MFQTSLRYYALIFLEICKTSISLNYICMRETERVPLLLCLSISFLQVPTTKSITDLKNYTMAFQVKKWGKVVSYQVSSLIIHALAC